MRLTGLLLICCALFPRTARGQTGGDTLIALPEITILGSSGQLDQANVPSHITVLGRDDARRRGLETVDAVLDAETGVLVRKYGPGGLSSVSVRGTSASQLAVAVDGHRLSDPQVGQMDLTLLPSFLFDRVELVRGGVSALYGSDAIAGVVNLRSVALEERRAEMRFTAGQWGDLGGGGLIARNVGGWDVAVGAELRRGDGSFPYRNYAAVPEETRRRDNADFRLGSLFLGAGKGEMHGGGRAFRFAALHTSAERGLPGIVGRGITGERQWDAQTRLWADYTARAGSGILRLGVLGQRMAIRYASPEAELEEEGVGYVAQASPSFEHLATRRWTIRWGVDLRYQQGDHPALHGVRREGLGAAYGSATGQYGPALLMPSVRLEAPFGSGYATTVSPRLGLSLRLSPDVTLKSTAARAYRSPTMNDRFWRGPGAAGDPDLQPEDAWTADAGLVFEVGGQLEASVFTSRVRNQIVWGPGDAGVWSPENVGRVHSRGGNVSYRSTRVAIWTLAMSARAHYAFTDARDRSDPTSAAYDSPVRHVPRHSAGGGVTLARGAVEMHADGRYMGDRPITSDGSQQQPSHFLVSGGVSVSVWMHSAGWRLSAFAENLTGRDYEIVVGYPMPPRNVRFELTLILK